jgi:hypothetical protein
MQEMAPLAHEHCPPLTAPRSAIASVRDFEFIFASIDHDMEGNCKSAQLDMRTVRA